MNNHARCICVNQARLIFCEAIFQRPLNEGIIRENNFAKGRLEEMRKTRVYEEKSIEKTI